MSQFLGRGIWQAEFRDLGRRSTDFLTPETRERLERFQREQAEKARLRSLEQKPKGGK